MTNLVPFMNRDFERLLNVLGGPETFNARNRLSTNNYRVDKSDTGVTIKFDMPGVSPEDIKVEVHNNVLSINGERNEVREVKSDNGEVVSKSTTIARYSNSFDLFDKFDSDKLEAIIENGVLEVTLPYAEEIAPKAIEVKVKDSSADKESKDFTKAMIEDNAESNKN